MGNKYAITDQGAIYFITFATVEWVDVFSRPIYRDILIDSLRHAQMNKGLIIYSWCIMSNHVHMVVKAANENLSDILRDLKTYTSKQILHSISTEIESRRNWMLAIFRKAGWQNSNNIKYQFWQQDNHCKEVFSLSFAFQKFNYIHNNPVKARIVDKAEEYIYSSARDFYFGKNCGLLKIEFWNG